MIKPIWWIPGEHTLKICKTFDLTSVDESYRLAVPQRGYYGQQLVEANRRLQLGPLLAEPVTTLLCRVEGLRIRLR